MFFGSVSCIGATRVQAYSAVFDASIETVPQSQPRGSSLTFDVYGEGNLPHIVVSKPTLRNKHGQPLLVFQRCLVGRSQTMPIVIVNDGSLTCKVCSMLFGYLCCSAAGTQ